MFATVTAGILIDPRSAEEILADELPIHDAPDAMEKTVLKNEIHRLESELRKRDQLIEGFVSVAAAQSKHISHLQSSTFTAPPAPSPPSSMSPVVSDSAATLPWQATMHTGTSPLPARPEDHPCEKSCLSLDREPDVETVGTTRAAASSLDTSTLPITTQTPSADPGAYSGHGTNTPVHTSTPNRANTCPRSSWTEVVRRGRRRVSAGPYPQTAMAISNRFTILPKDASVHPDDAPAVSTSPAPEVTSAASAASHGKATHRSSAVNDRRMLLKEAVIRRSGGLPGVVMWCRLRCLVKQLERGVASVVDLKKNLEYAATVLESLRLVDPEDELSNIQSDSVPSEVRDWLASTFTRQRGLMLRRNEDKPRFRSIVHAVQAGIFVERALEAELKMEFACASRVSVPQPRQALATPCPEDWKETTNSAVYRDMTLPPRGRVQGGRYTPSSRHQSFEWDQQGQPICRGCGRVENDVGAPAVAPPVNQELRNGPLLRRSQTKQGGRRQRRGNPGTGFAERTEEKGACWSGSLSRLVTRAARQHLLERTPWAIEETAGRHNNTRWNGLSAAIHDYEHTGTTNNFHIQTRSDTAMLYNDRAVLENHHVNAAYRLLQDDDDMNILTNLSKDDWREMRTLVVEMVLATDMSCHFQQIKAMKSLLQQPESIDKPKALSLLLHTADISHPAKRWDLHHRWTTSLLE
ncbi:hypothetical protein PAMA_008866 [Pampus argenteus]